MLADSAFKCSFNGFFTRPLGELTSLDLIKAGDDTGTDVREFRFASLYSIFQQTQAIAKDLARVLITAGLNQLSYEDLLLFCQDHVSGWHMSPRMVQILERTI